ncbi:MAG: hypothetical protein VZS44_08270 [Bacilli bacterium]|nr:hypothetical protein [Bacilli bacterium]
MNAPYPLGDYFYYVTILEPDNDIGTLITVNSEVKDLQVDDLVRGIIKYNDVNQTIEYSKIICKYRE